jgi:hypothetical protein
MSVHYHVNTEYVLAQGKPSIKCLSFNSTKSACTTLPIYSISSPVKTYRIFQILQEAHFYIAYLQKLYKKSTAPPPELDSGQKELFTEVSK